MPSQSTTCVPGGTRTTRSSPSAPWRSAPSPWRAARGLVVRPALEGLQVAQRVVAQQHDVAAAPAVAAVGPAARHVGLAAERAAAVPAAAALHEDARLVVEHARPIVERTHPMADDDSLPHHRRLDGIGAATARHAAAGRLPPRARRALARTSSQALADELGGDERALAVRCDVTDWEEQEALVAARARALRPPRRRLRQRRLRRRARLPRGRRPSTGARWSSPTCSAPPTRSARRSRRCKESTGHILLTGSVAGRRAIPGSLYSWTKWAVTGMGESLRQDVDGTGVRVTVDRARAWSTRRSSTTPARDACEADDIARAVHVRGRPARRTSTSTRSSYGPTAQSG